MMWATIENNAVTKVFKSIEGIAHQFADNRKVGDLSKEAVSVQIEAGYYPLEEVNDPYDPTWQMRVYDKDSITSSKVLRYYTIENRPIDELKAAKVADIDEYFWQRRNSDFEWNGKDYQSDLESRFNIDTTYARVIAGRLNLAAFELNGITGLPWRATDNTSTTFTVNEDFLQFGDMAWAAGAGRHYTNVTLKLQVSALATSKEVAEYDVEASWAAVETAMIAAVEATG
ncbi:MAG: hypothetical protein AAF512_02035 [Pseudomonadota bacterium]